MDDLTPKQALKFFGILILLHAAVNSGHLKTPETIKRSGEIVDQVLKECGIE